MEEKHYSNSLLISVTPIVAGYKPFGSPNIGEFLFPVMKQFLGKGND